MPKYTMESGGKTYTFSSDSPLSDSDLQAAAAQYFGPETKPAAPKSTFGQIVSEEAGKLPGKIASDIKGVGEFVANPPMKDILPWTLGPVGKGAATGIAAGLARGGARSTAAGIGAAMDAPAGQKTKEGLKTGGIAAAWEAALGAIPIAKIPLLTSNLKTVAGRLEGREKEFQRATEAPMKAYNALRGSVPQQAFMRVPTISSRDITFLEASKGLENLKGRDWETARQEIFRELERIEKAGLATQPYAAEGFKARVPDARFDPPSTGLERFAKETISTVRNPAVRTATDEAAAKQRQGVPVGVFPLAAIAEGGGSLLDFLKRYVPAAK